MPEQAVPATPSASAGGRPAPSSSTWTDERRRGRAGPTTVVRHRAGVPQHVAQRLLQHPVGRDVERLRQRRRRLAVHLQLRPAARRPAPRRAARRPGPATARGAGAVRGLAEERRPARAARRPTGGPAARRPAAPRRRGCPARPSSAGRRAAATITLTEWATESCTSRAIRARSAATAVASAISRSASSRAASRPSRSARCRDRRVSSPTAHEPHSSRQKKRFSQACDGAAHSRMPAVASTWSAGRRPPRAARTDAWLPAQPVESSRANSWAPLGRSSPSAEPTGNVRPTTTRGGRPADHGRQQPGDGDQAEHRDGGRQRPAPLPSSSVLDDADDEHHERPAPGDGDGAQEGRARGLRRAVGRRGPLRIGTAGDARGSTARGTPRASSVHRSAGRDRARRGQPGARRSLAFSASAPPDAREAPP